MTRRPTAVDLDRFLARLTPEAMAAIQAAMPAGWVDQQQAAQGEAITLAAAMMGQLDSAQLVAPAAIDDWLRLGALDALLTWVSGDARTCLHAPEPRRPEPVFTAAWRPGLVVCTECLRPRRR